jgi:selenocysteine lyase/cysteine desulfurase
VVVSPGVSRELAAARALFHPTVTYLDTATSGLPPDPAWQALQDAQARWRDGTAQAATYDASVSAARAAFAELVGVPVAWVATANQASVFVGMVAAALPDGAEVLTAENEFTSVTFPFHAQGRLRVREVPLERLAEEVRAGTDLVAFAAVQSADGRLADLEAIREACAGHGTRTLVDATQAAGWLPLRAADFDVTVTSAYKWLLAPRGSAFMTIRPEVAADVVPVAANWYAGADRWSSIYGTPLRLAEDARRFDVSPAWHVWEGTAPAVRLLADLGADTLHRHALGLANAFRREVALPESDSAIASLQLLPGAEERVHAAGIKAAMRDGRMRLSFHVHNDERDVAVAAEALGGYVRT